MREFIAIVTMVCQISYPSAQKSPRCKADRVVSYKLSKVTSFENFAYIDCDVMRNNDSNTGLAFEKCKGTRFGCRFETDSGTMFGAALCPEE